MHNISTTPTPSDEDVSAEARAQAARLMGQVRSEAKARAARENGRRGGRPPGIPQSEETRRKISQAKRSQRDNTT